MGGSHSGQQEGRNPACGFMIIFVIFLHVPICERVVIELIWTILIWSYMFYMKVDKWTRCGHCVILGLG